MSIIVIPASIVAVHTIVWTSFLIICMPSLMCSELLEAASPNREMRSPPFATLSIAAAVFPDS